MRSRRGTITLTESFENVGKHVFANPNAVVPDDDFGLPIDAEEAMLFAVLGAETLRGAPANIPSATGATRPVVLGQIVPGRGWPGCLSGLASR